MHHRRHLLHRQLRAGEEPQVEAGPKEDLSCPITSPCVVSITLFFKGFATRSTSIEGAGTGGTASVVVAAAAAAVVAAVAAAVVTVGTGCRAGATAAATGGASPRWRAERRDCRRVRSRGDATVTGGDELTLHKVSHVGHKVLV